MGLAIDLDNTDYTSFKSSSSTSSTTCHEASPAHKHRPRRAMGVILVGPIQPKDMSRPQLMSRTRQDGKLRRLPSPDNHDYFRYYDYSGHGELLPAR